MAARFGVLGIVLQCDTHTQISHWMDENAESHSSEIEHSLESEGEGATEMAQSPDLMPLYRRKHRIRISATLSQ